MTVELELLTLGREGMKRGLLMLPTGRMRGSRHRFKPMKFHPNVRKIIITCYQTLAHIAQRGFGVSVPGVIQILAGPSPLADPALALMLDYMTFRDVPYNLSYSVLHLSPFVMR